MSKIIDKEPKKNPRWIATRILLRVENQNSYLDKLLESEFNSNKLNEKDKRLLNEIANGVLRHKNYLDWIIKQFFNGDFIKINSYIKNTLRVALYQMFFLDKIPEYAIVNDAVEGVKVNLNEKFGKLINAILRNVIRNKEKISFPDKHKNQIEYLTVFHSHPEWLVKKWLSRFPFDEVESLLKSNNKVKTLSVRINHLKTSSEKLEINLLSKKIKFERSPLSDNFLLLENFGELSNLDFFNNGEIYIQDVSAGLAVRLLDPQKNERIIDLCAAPGGKLTYISELMENTGEVLAVDIFEMRLKTLLSNCEKLGITNVKTMISDARNLETESADRVLVDAPCSGLGTLSKKPDIKWKQDLNHIFKLNIVQNEILANASKLVKPNGILVYSTCTIEPEENFKIIENFVANHNNFLLEDASSFVPKEIVDSNGCVQSLPHKHFTDGSFAARLKRII